MRLKVLCAALLYLQSFHVSATVQFPIDDCRQMVAVYNTISARIIALNSRPALIFRDVNKAEAILETLRVNPDIIIAALYDKHDRVLTSYQIHSDYQLPPEVLPTGQFFAENGVGELLTFETIWVRDNGGRLVKTGPVFLLTRFSACPVS